MFPGITVEGQIKDHFRLKTTPGYYISLLNRPAGGVGREENNPENSKGMRAASEKDSMRCDKWCAVLAVIDTQRKLIRRLRRKEQIQTQKGEAGTCLWNDMKFSFTSLKFIPQLLFLYSFVVFFLCSCLLSLAQSCVCVCFSRCFFNMTADVTEQLHSI